MKADRFGLFWWASGLRLDPMAWVFSGVSLVFKIATEKILVETFELYRKSLTEMKSKLWGQKYESSTLNLMQPVSHKGKPEIWRRNVLRKEGEVGKEVAQVETNEIRKEKNQPPVSYWPQFDL